MVAILYAAHAAEMQLARLARKRGHAPEVRVFAEDVLLEHDRALRRQSELLLSSMITPVECDTSRALTARARQVESRLSSLTLIDFDRAYVQAEVESQTQLNQLLGFDLLPQAQRAEIKHEIEILRPTVHRHQSEASELRYHLADNGLTAQPPSGPGS